MKITKYKPNQDSKGNINFKILSQSRTAGPNRAFLQNMLVKLEPSESRGTFEPAIVPRIRQALLQPSKLQVKIPIAIHIMTRPKLYLKCILKSMEVISILSSGMDFLVLVEHWMQSQRVVDVMLPSSSGHHDLVWRWWVGENLLRSSRCHFPMASESSWGHGRKGGRIDGLNIRLNSCTIIWRVRMAL